MWRATWPYLPAPLLRLTKYTPTALYGRLRRLNAMFADVGRPLYKSNAEEWDGSREERRDVMSVLSEYFGYIFLSGSAFGAGSLTSSSQSKLIRQRRRGSASARKKF